MTATAELATAADYNIDGLDELAQVWAEAAQGDPNFRPILPSLKVPAGGSTTWEDKDDASFEPRRELEVVILHSQVTTQLYLTDYEDSSDESRRPDAWSDDGIVQVVPAETYEKINALNATNGWALPYPSTDLSLCPYNKFVGDPGAAIKPGQTGGKWNAEYHELYVVVKGSQEPVPYKVRVSPASIKQWAGGKGYKNTLLSRGVRLHTLETVLTLQPMKSGNITYSEIIFNRGRLLDPVLKDKMGELAEGIRRVSQGGMFAIGGAPLAQQLAAAQAQPQIAAPAAAPAPVQIPVQAPVYADVQQAIPSAPVPPQAAALDQAFAEAVTAPEAPPAAAPAPAPAAPPAAAPAPAPQAPPAAAPAPTPAPAPAAAPPAADPGVQNVAESFGATPVAPTPAAPAPQAPPAAAPAPQAAPVAPAPAAAPAPAPVAAPTAAPVPAPQPAPVAAPAQAQPAAEPVPAAVGSGAPAEDDGINF